MFEKYRFQNKLRFTLYSVAKFRAENKADVKRKLQLYKQLKRNPNQQIINETLTIVQNQEEFLKGLNSLIIGALSTGHAFEDLGKLTERMKIIIDLFIRGQSLLRNLLLILHSQKSILSENISLEEKIGKYRSYFKDELKIYKEFDASSEDFPQEVFNELAVELTKREPFPALEEYLIPLLVVMIMYAIVGAYDPKLIENNFKHLEGIIINLGLTGAALYVVNRIVRIIRILKKIKKIS